jgi:hypothetical protein
MFSKEKTNGLNNVLNYLHSLYTYIVGSYPQSFPMAFSEAKTKKYSLHILCCVSNLELATKTKHCKGASQEWSPGIIIHAPKSVRKCEGMNPHTPNFENGSLDGLLNF